MVRRPLAATAVTTVVGALLGAVLGAVVGRVIALFGDETVQVTVPMVFCGAIGYFVGGASAAKGSLERFGARRTALGTTVAALIIVAMVGYTFLSGAAGLAIGLVGVIAAALGGAVAASIAAPQSEPVVRGQRPRAVAAPPKEAKAAPQESAEAEFLDTSAVSAATTRKPAIRKVPVAKQSEPEVLPADDSVNWSLDERESAEPGITPPPDARPRRDRPLRKGDSSS